MDDLKACPFCGQIPVMRGAARKWVECDNDACEVSPASRSYVSEAAATHAWNARVKPVGGEK